MSTDDFEIKIEFACKYPKLKLPQFISYLFNRKAEEAISNIDEKASRIDFKAGLTTFTGNY